MKLTELLRPLTLALMAVLATTGCKHGLNGKGQVMYGDRPIVSNNQDLPATIPAPPPMPPEQPPFVVNNQPIPTSTNWDPALMNQNRDKLAAYTVHFKYDSTVIQDNERANVASVGQALSADLTADLLIEGHCDERGTEEYNRSLGERRALALREALAAIGVNPSRIRTVSYGKDQPVDPGHDQAAWAKNRRGQFIYCTPKGPTQ